MKVYLAGTQVQLAVSFTDTDGNALSVSSATYKIVDDRSKEIQAVTSFDTTQDTLTIASELNQIASLNVDALTSEEVYEVRLNEARVVEFELTLDDGNIYPYDMVYVLVPRERLITGLNSFQSLRQAYLTALSLPGTTFWNTASEDDRVTAMIEARLRICSLQFRDVTLGQAYLSEEKMVGDLSRLSPSEFKELTARLRKALCMAQIAEAEEILSDGGEANSARRSGLISQTIGETQDVYRSSKPIDMQVSKSALRYIGEYISLNMKVGRAG